MWKMLITKSFFQMAIVMHKTNFLKISPTSWENGIHISDFFWKSVLWSECSLFFHKYIIKLQNPLFLQKKQNNLPIGTGLLKSVIFVKISISQEKQRQKTKTAFFGHSQKREKPTVKQISVFFLAFFFSFLQSVMRISQIYKIL